MKSTDRTVFETILALAVLLALISLPFAAHAGCGMPPIGANFTEIDVDGDGFVSVEEFDAFHAQCHEQMSAQGKPMKGMAMTPKFEDIDTDGDGKLSEAELTAAHQAHMQAMREAHAGMGQGMGMHHGMGMKMPTFEQLDLNGDGCISPDEFAQHQAAMHGGPKPPAD